MSTSTKGYVRGCTKLSSRHPRSVDLDEANWRGETLRRGLLQQERIHDVKAANATRRARPMSSSLIIQLAIVPASFALEHSPEHTGQGLHCRLGFIRHTHHLIVAEFEARGGARIADAKVTVIVSSNLGLMQQVALESMAFGEAGTYGGFVEMPPRDLVFWSRSGARKGKPRQSRVLTPALATLSRTSPPSPAASSERHLPDR
jgi:hypothetical protein